MGRRVVPDDLGVRRIALLHSMEIQVWEGLAPDSDMD